MGEMTEFIMDAETRAELARVEAAPVAAHFALMLQVQGGDKTITIVCDTLDSAWRPYPAVGDSHFVDVAYIFDQQMAKKLREGLEWALPLCEAESGKIMARVRVGSGEGYIPVHKGHLAGGQPEDDRDEADGPNS